MDGWSRREILFVKFFYGSNLCGLAGLGETADCTCDLCRTSNTHFFCVCVRRSALSKVTNFQSVSGSPDSPFFMRCRVRGKSVQSVKSSVLSHLFLSNSGVDSWHCLKLQGRKNKTAVCGFANKP